jgi:uncharacterized protein (TIGR04222 family)
MNPITDFNAREFLTFYALFILVVWMVRSWFDWQSDQTLDDTWTPPGAVNPYDVAYLRGGANELARVAIVGLAERGFLDVRAQAIGQATGHPNPASLTSLERSVFDFFEPERTVRDIEQAGLRVRVNAHVLSYEERLQSQQLLSPPNVVHAARRSAFLAAATIVVVGFARFLVALERHRPAGFLIAMGIVGAIVVGWPSIGRLSRRGKAYLNSLRGTASSFNARGAESSDTTLLMASALFGMTALSGSPHEDLGEMFTRQKASSGDSSGGAAGWFGGGGDGGGGSDGGGGGGGGSDGGGGGGSCGGGGGGCGGCGGGGS